MEPSLIPEVIDRPSSLLMASNCKVGGDVSLGGWKGLSGIDMVG